MAKVKILFCQKCHKVKIVGHWKTINEEIVRILKHRVHDWEAQMTICSDCEANDEKKTS